MRCAERKVAAVAANGKAEAARIGIGIRHFVMPQTGLGISGAKHPLLKTEVGYIYIQTGNTYNVTQ